MNTHKPNCQMSSMGWAASIPPECTCAPKEVKCCSKCAFHTYKAWNNIKGECQNLSCPCHSPSDAGVKHKNHLNQETDVNGMPLSGGAAKRADYSHFHCWNQNGAPACGIPLENHTQCCLCAVEYDSSIKEWHRRHPERFQPPPTESCPICLDTQPHKHEQMSPEQRDKEIARLVEIVKENNRDTESWAEEWKKNPPVDVDALSHEEETLLKDFISRALRTERESYQKELVEKIETKKSDGKIVLNGIVEDRPSEHRDFTATTAYNQGLEDSKEIIRSLN